MGKNTLSINNDLPWQLPQVPVLPPPIPTVTQSLPPVIMQDREMFALGARKSAKQGLLKSGCRQNLCDLKCVPPADIFGWLQEAEQITPEPLNQGTIWKVDEAKQEDPPCSESAVRHTCAPPPGWKVVNGITVPQSFCSPDIANLKANDSYLAVVLHQMFPFPSGETTRF